MYKKFCTVGIVLISLSVGLDSVYAQKSGYIIVYKSHAQKQKAFDRGQHAFKRKFDIIPASSADLDTNELEQLRRDPDVEYVEPDYRFYAMGNESAGSVSSGSGTAGVTTTASSQTIPYGITMVNAPLVWPKTMGAGVRVAVLDTGIDMSHPDRGNVVASISEVSGETVDDLDGHGTHTSGTIAAADNGIGVVGVAPECELLICKVLDNTGSGSTTDIMAGLQWAVNNNAKVISMSFGGSDNSQAFKSACDAAFAAGALLVAAAGNNGNTGDATAYPAAFSSVIAVAAIDSNKSLPSPDFSNFGSYVALAAPGVGVESTIPPGIGPSTADAIWSSASHTAYPVTGTTAGTPGGQICDCGLASGSVPDVCPPSVAGNIAFIRRGTYTFAQKVAYVQSQGAIGAIIADNGGGNISGFVLNGVTPLVVVAISQSDGDALLSLIPAGITGAVSITDLYESYDGTSMACPHVAGVAALVFAASGINTSPSEVRTILENSAQDLGAPGWDQYYGYGLVNASAAMNLVTAHNCSAVWVLGNGLAGDINRDCAVNWKDMQLLGAEWLSTPCNSANNWCSGSDIRQTGSVNIADFAQLARTWLQCNDPQHLSCN